MTCSHCGSKVHQERPQVARDAYGRPTAETMATIARWPEDDLQGLLTYFLEAWDAHVHLSVRSIGFECDQLGIYEPIHSLVLNTRDSAVNESLVVALKCSPLWKKAWLLTAREGVHVINLSGLTPLNGQSR